MKPKNTILIAGFLILLQASAALACETATITVTGNLDSLTPVGDSPPDLIRPAEEQIANAQATQTIEIFDSLGHRHVVVAAFYRQTGSVPWIGRLVTADSNSGPRNAVAIGDEALRFDENGDRQDPRDTLLGMYEWLDGGGSNAYVIIRFSVTNRPVATGTFAMQDGAAGGCPQRGSLDFDGDGRDDLAIWRPEFGMWAVLKSSLQGTDLIFKQWGLPGDYPIPGDYTGDGKADLVLYRGTTAQWFVCKSELNFNCAQPQIVQFGLPGDVPVKGDYDGDGLIDFAVYRLSTGTFFYRSSRTTELIQRQWGLAKDIPLQAVINQRPQ